MKRNWPIKIKENDQQKDEIDANSKGLTRKTNEKQGKKIGKKKWGGKEFRIKGVRKEKVLMKSSLRIRRKPRFFSQ